MGSSKSKGNLLAAQFSLGLLLWLFNCYPIVDLMKLLIADDHPDILHNLKVAMTEAGYEVDTAADGVEALYYLSNWEYDGVILDVMMPELDGISVLKKVRYGGCSTPVLLLTVKDSHEEIIAGLDSGADDYLVKPFNYSELMARVRAMLRRSAGGGADVIRIENVEINLASKDVTVDGDPIFLARQEYMIFLVLATRRGQVISRTTLFDRINDDQGDVNSNLLDVLMYNIRQKVGKDLIKTRRGQGFIIDAP